MSRLAIKIIVKWLLPKTGFSARRKRGASKIAAHFTCHCTNRAWLKWQCASHTIHWHSPCYTIFLRLWSGSERSQYDTFWGECDKFLQEDIMPATDDRRHGNICHLSRAISICDLIDQVKSRCPPDTLIPSLEWVRLQYWPKTSSSAQQTHHTGRFKMKYMIQQRQWGASAFWCTLCCSYVQVWNWHG